MPVSKQTRRSRHEQAEAPTLERGNPSSSEGRVGTQQFRTIAGKGLVHMVRSETGWKEMGSSQTNTNQGDKVESTTISAGISASNSVGGGTAISVHGNLTSLSEDDHSQYVHLSNVRTISGNHVFSGNPNFTGTPIFTGIDINGGDIASGTTINKSPVVTLAGDLGGNATFSNLGNATLTATIQPNSVALTTDTTGNYMTNVTGNSQVSVSHSQGEGSTAALSIAGDSIGDTQLAYNTGQHLTTSSAPTFATVNTGQGANELYDMNQNVLTTSNVTFGDIIVDGDDITSNPFSSGFTGGGWKIDNTAHAEFSSASIRGTLSVYELLLQQLRATNGSVLITAVAKVESIDGSDITFEDPSDNGVCPFHDNDIVMVQRADLTGTSGADNGGGTLDIIRRIVRRVTSVSGRTITVSSAEDGDLPADTGSFGVGDDVVRIGNTTNTNRDAILYLSADDSKAPYLVIKDGVNSWANWNSASTEKARLGRLDGITDTDAGLSGSQSNTYGLYSDNVHLKGHIFATSGKIGGISMASSKIYTGTGTHNNANTGFYIDSSSNFSLGNKLSWNGSTLSITGDITISNTGDFAPSNATNNRSDSATDSAVNSASKTGGSVGGWSLSGSAITGSNIVMSSNGTIAVANGYTLNNDGSASFANGGITFATNGDITSNTFLLERTRLFGAGEDGTVVLYAGTCDATYKVSSTQINSQHSQSIITRSGSTWSMQGDCYFDTLTISSTGGALVLNTNGFRLFVKNTFTIASSCYVSCNGSSPSGYDDGDAHGGGSASGTLSRGAQGHAGGAVGSGTGSGGDGGRGGASGGGGGIVFISARIISNSGYIHAKGGNGHAGQQGGSD
tara:strand:- start:8029 stop:10575 length:2547 start_codon:yes stop_codon:yes gene_type:complete